MRVSYMLYMLRIYKGCVFFVIGVLIPTSKNRKVYIYLN